MPAIDSGADLLKTPVFLRFSGAVASGSFVRSSTPLSASLQKSLHSDLGAPVDATHGRANIRHQHGSRSAARKTRDGSARFSAAVDPRLDHKLAEEQGIPVRRAGRRARSVRAWRRTGVVADAR